MRLAGNHDRLSFLIPVIKIDCVCSMSMVGYVAMSSVVRDGIITEYNTVMYAVLFARVRLLPCLPVCWLALKIASVLPSNLQVTVIFASHPPCGYVFRSYGWNYNRI